MQRTDQWIQASLFEKSELNNSEEGYLGSKFRDQCTDKWQRFILTDGLFLWMRKSNRMHRQDAYDHSFGEKRGHVFTVLYPMSKSELLQ